MNKTHRYHSRVEWTGNTGSGTAGYKAYERSHNITVANKAIIQASSDPSFRGDSTKHNPEELFLSSLSSCHMLWFLHLCAEAGVVVTAYEDNAEGIMVENADGSGQFSEVTLHPLVTISDSSKAGLLDELHHNANSKCFIARSCNFPIRHDGRSKAAAVTV